MLEISKRDIAFGVAGTLIGGIFIWLLTKNIEFGAQLQALQKIDPLVTQAYSQANRADALASEAIGRANEALRNVQTSEKEARRIIANITTAPLFEKIDESVEKLEKAAAEAAENKVKEEVKIEVTRAAQDKLRSLGGLGKWPHALDCGASWVALYFLHGAPNSTNGTVQYDQIYASEHRYVRFSADGKFHDRGGHGESSLGCDKKSLDILRSENRAFTFLGRDVGG